MQFAAPPSPKNYPRDDIPGTAIRRIPRRSAAIFRKNHYFYILKNYFCTIPDKL